MSELERRRFAFQLTLSVLAEDEIATIIAQICVFDGATLQRIQERAAGNPFFAEELARTINEEALHPQTGKSTRPPSPASRPDLPSTIAATLDLRLRNLSDDCQRFLGKIAVFGSSVELAVIQSLMRSHPHTAVKTAEDTLLYLLEEAMQSGLLTEEILGAQVSYQFWHPLLVEHLYQKLSGARRAFYHRQAAEILRHVYRDQETEWAEAITTHLLKGDGDKRLLSHYAQVAGERAIALSSYATAEHFYRIALQHQDKQESWLQRAFLLERTAFCVRITGDFDDAILLFQQLLRYRAERSLPSEKEMHIQARISHEIARLYIYQCRIDEGMHSIQNGYEILQQAQVSTGLAYALLLLESGYAAIHKADFALGAERGYQALAAFERLEEEASSDASEGLDGTQEGTYLLMRSPGDPGRAHSFLGLCKITSGEVERGIDHLKTAIRYFDRDLGRYRREKGIALGNLGEVYLRMAEYAQAQEIILQAVKISKETGDQPSLIIHLGNLGILAQRKGLHLEAERRFADFFALDIIGRHDQGYYRNFFHTYLLQVRYEQGGEKAQQAVRSLCSLLRNISRQPKLRYISPYHLAFLALAQVRLVRYEEGGKIVLQENTRMLQRAKNTLERALSLNNQEAELPIETKIFLAQTYLMLNEIEEAEHLALDSLHQAQFCRSVWLVARAYRILGMVRIKQRQPDAARQCFLQALSMMRTRGMTSDYHWTLQFYAYAVRHWMQPKRILVMESSVS